MVLIDGPARGSVLSSRGKGLCRGDPSSSGPGLLRGRRAGEIWGNLSEILERF